MNVGSLTWEQAAAALGCTTAAMAQWKTGKTGLSAKTIYLLEQKEGELGIATAVREDPGEYVAGDPAREMRRDLREVQKELAAIGRRVNGMLKKLEEK